MITVEGVVARVGAFGPLRGVRPATLVHGALRRIERRWWPALVPLAASAFVFAIVALTWFSAGQFFATGDIGPFVREGLRAEIGSLWTHQNSGAGGPAYTVVRAVELVAIDVARFLGGGEPLAQRLLYASMFAFGAGGTAALALRIVERPVLAFGAGVIGTFNLFFLAGLPNYLPVVVLGIVASAAALAIDAARGKRPRWFGLVLLTLALSYVALNPPLVAVTLAALATLPLVAAALTGTGMPGARRVLRLLGIAAAVALPLAAWWVVPQVMAVRAASAAGAVGAQTDVGLWSWTHRNNSLANVLTFRSSWSWPDPAYHGRAAVALGAPALAWLAWTLPAGLAVAPLWGRRSLRSTASWLAVGAAALLVVGKGLHGPLSGLNRLLYDIVPGSWLLREPMSKVGVLVLMAQILSWTIAVDGVFARLRTEARRRRRGALSAVAALLVGGPLWLGLPMLSGIVTRDEIPGRSEQVRIPEGWKAIAADVNGSPLAGKALVLPLVDFYQVPTTWGFYGNDTLVRGLLRRPVLQRNPQGYITDTPEVDALVRSVEEEVASGHVDAVRPLLRLLGVSHVIVRTDLDPASPIRSLRTTDPEALLRTLAAVEGLAEARVTDVAALYEVSGPTGMVEARSSALVADRLDATTLPALVTTLPPDLAVTDDPAAGTGGRAWTARVGDAVPFVNDEDGAPHVVSRQVLGGSIYEITRVASAEGDTVLRFRDVAPPTLGGTALPARPDVVFTVAGDVVALEVEGARWPLGTQPALGGLGSTVVPLSAERTSALGELGPVGDCRRTDDRSPAEVGLVTRELTVGGGWVVELGAEAHAACRRAEVFGATAGSVYHVRLEGRSLRGSPARTCLWLVGPDACSPLPGWSEGDADGWAHIDTLVDIPDGTRQAFLFLYADGPADPADRTVTQYRWPDVRPVSRLDPLPLERDSTVTGRMILPAGSYDLAVPGLAPVTPGAWSPVGDCNRKDGRSLEEVGIGAAPLDGPAGGTRLVAADHAACVSAPLDGLAEGVRYELRLEHRSERGRPSRVCVFDRAANACLSLSGAAAANGTLGGSSDWATAAVTFTAPTGPAVIDGESRFRLYVYADGTAGGTATEYRAISVLPAARDRVVVSRMPPSGERTVPALSWVQRGPARYDVTVEGAAGPFVLALSEAYSPGWRLRGGPDGTGERPVRLDGYRNGWVIDSAGDLELSLEYAPDRTARRAIVLSVLTGIGVVSGMAARRAWRLSKSTTIAR